MSLHFRCRHHESQGWLPSGRGRPLNGGLNTGGGILIISSFVLNKSLNFQSTLQHELGHTFGLPHVDVYGYDMNNNSSLMSYNLKHHTRGFEASTTPGGLIPEDLRALALNKRVFPKSRFDPYSDIPPGYTIAKRIIVLGPMQIPGQPGVKVTTNSGQAFGTKVQNIVQGQIASSRKSGVTTFDSATMWHSDASPTGWVSVQITFPFEVELSGVRVHSQHSGQYHAAQAVRVHGMTEKGILRRVAEQPLRSIDELVPLPTTRARTWEFEFQAGESKMVVLRGLQFYSSKDEIFPTLVPIGF